MMNLNGIKKLSFICFNILIAICLLKIFNIQENDTALDRIFKTISCEELSSLEVINSHISTTENGNLLLIPENDDPQIYLPVVDSEINCIQIEFAEKLEDTIFFDLYYSNASGTPKSDKNPLSTLAFKNDSIVNIFLPEDRYTALRLDINGKCAVETIRYGISEDNSSAIPGRYFKINIISLIALVLLFLILGLGEQHFGYFKILVDLFKSCIETLKKTRFFKQIKDRFFNDNEYIETNRSERKIANSFACLALVFGTVVIFLVPPASTPDETTAHYFNVCRIVSGDLFVDKYQGEVGEFLYPQEINFMGDADSKYALSIGSHRFSVNEINRYDNEYQYSGEAKIFLKSEFAKVNPFGYLSSVWMPRLVKLFFGINSPYELMILAKFSNLIFSILIIRWAILLAPIFKKTIFLIALMPMTIYQYTSLSYDVEAICGSILLFACMVKVLLASDEYKILRKDIFAVCLSSSCLFASKIVYVPLLIILFSLSKKHFGSTKKYIISIGLVILTGVAFWIFPMMYSNFVIGFAERNMLEVEQIKFLLENIDMVPTIFINSFIVSGKFYLYSFVGDFGWLNVPTPYIFTLLYIIFLLFTALIEMSETRKISILTKTLSIVALLISTFGIIFSMYICWNPVVGAIKSAYALGVQGRYFIPIAVYIPLCFANTFLCRFKYIRNINLYLETCSKIITIGYLIILIIILFSAYWVV